MHYRGDKPNCHITATNNMFQNLGAFTQPHITQLFGDNHYNPETMLEQNDAFGLLVAHGYIHGDPNANANALFWVGPNGYQVEGGPFLEGWDV